MMYPRLKLARNLLRQDGVIFISIDDNEVTNLRRLCDEVFGERNFVANLIWQSTPGSHTGDDLKTVTENVLLYGKDKENCRFLNQCISNGEKYVNKDEFAEKRGGYVLNKLDRRMTGPHYSDALNYSIETPDGTRIFPGSSTEKQAHWNWRWSVSKVQWGIANGFIVFKQANGSWSVYFKQYEKVDNEDKPIIRRVPYQNLLNVDGANSARGTAEVMEIFDGKFFDYPKPISLLCHLLNMALSFKDIVLDFFSGSATTAHAVMKLNAEDGGNRKFIMVQLPEACDEKSEAFKAGYRNICKIGKERIRRAGKKIVEENATNAPNLDIGFRVLKLDSSSLNDTSATVSETTQEFENFDRIKSDRSPEDLLFQMLLETRIPLSDPIVTAKICGNQVFAVGVVSGEWMVDSEGSLITDHSSLITLPLIACLDHAAKMTTEFFIEVAKLKPGIAFFRDDAFADDSARTNLQQAFDQFSPTTSIKVV